MEDYHCVQHEFFYWALALTLLLTQFTVNCINSLERVQFTAASTSAQPMVMLERVATLSNQRPSGNGIDRGYEEKSLIN